MNADTIRSFATHLETREHGANTVELWRDDETHRPEQWRTHWVIVNGRPLSYRSYDFALEAMNGCLEEWDDAVLAAETNA